jgi:hypothetical protein
VRCEVDPDTVVNIRPFGMMIQLFDQYGRGRHKAKGVGEIGKLVFPVQLRIQQAPARQALQFRAHLIVSQLSSLGHVVIVGAGK